MRCQTSAHHLTARSRAGNRLMTEKVLLSDIKQTQNRYFPLCLCVLCGKKTKPNLRTLSRSSHPQTRSKKPAQHRGEKVYARKSFAFAHKTRIKPVPLQMRPTRSANKRGIVWRIMADFVVACGGLWRILSQYGAANILYIDHSRITDLPIITIQMGYNHHYAPSRFMMKSRLHSRRQDFIDHAKRLL